MVNTVLSYLHTRPTLITTERVPLKSPGKKKDKTEAYNIREHQRHFYVVPDLLAAPGTINFRIIVDDYYTIVPEGTNPVASEMRRAYVQYAIDPVVRRYNREIAARREQLKLLLEERAKAGGTVSPDVFLSVVRSVVAAADARLEERMRLNALQDNIRRRLAATKDDAARARITQESQPARAAIADETMAELAGDYERGAVLAFFFADQLRDLEGAGFGFADFFADMIASFDPVREARRPADYAAAVTRAAAARKAHPHYAQWMMNPGAMETSAADPARNAGLVKGLSEVEKLRQLKNYEEAEARLKSLLQEFPGDARVLFTMGQTASLWARESTDDELQTQRLNRALANYRLAVAAALPDADRALLSHAHEAMGRILAFLDNDAEALKEFEAAISLGDVPGGAYQDAVAGKQKLGLPK
jgi:tetratricopeptide (TPR) repeat protein